MVRLLARPGGNSIRSNAKHAWLHTVRCPERISDRIRVNGLPQTVHVSSTR